jgi:uncharacterized membrane protein
MTFLKAYLATGIVFAVLDAVWLGVVARGFFQSQLGDLMRAKILFAPAIAFYVLFIAGLVVFAVLPGTSLINAAVLGGFFGLVAYGTYDLTNFSTLKGWPLKMVAVDMVSGVTLSAACAAGGWQVLQMWR